jgi:hypothetical protein
MPTRQTVVRLNRFYYVLSISCLRLGPVGSVTIPISLWLKLPLLEVREYVPDHKRETWIALHFLEKTRLVQNRRLWMSLLLYFDLCPLTSKYILQEIFLVMPVLLERSPFLKPAQNRFFLFFTFIHTITANSIL